MKKYNKVKIVVVFHEKDVLTDSTFESLNEYDDVISENLFVQ